MVKYHIGANGPAICKAAEGNCRYQKNGEDSPHFESKLNAENFSNFTNELTFDNTVSTVETNNLSSKEIKAYLNHIEQELNNLESEQESKDNIVNQRYNQEIDKSFENLDEATKEIIKNTQEYIEEGYIKFRPSSRFNIQEPYYTTYEGSPTPNAYLKGIEGPVKVVAQHALVHKFGKLKSKAITRPSDFSEKNLSWIKQYKENPEMLERDLALIKKNMSNFNRTWTTDMSGNPTLKFSVINSQIRAEASNKINPTAGNREISKKREDLKRLKDKLEREFNIHQKIESFNTKSQISSNINIEKEVPVTDGLYEKSQAYEIKDKITTDSKGKINNVFIYNSTNDTMERVVQINDSITENIVTDSGKVINFETRYARRTHGRWAMAHDNKLPYEIIVTKPNNKSKEYSGSKNIHRNHVDTTG